MFSWNFKQMLQHTFYPLLAAGIMIAGITSPIFAHLIPASKTELIDAMTEDELAFYIKSLDSAELDDFIRSLNQETVIWLVDTLDNSTVAYILHELDWRLKQYYLGRIDDSTYMLLVSGIDDERAIGSLGYETKETFNNTYIKDVIVTLDPEIYGAAIAGILVSIDS